MGSSHEGRKKRNVADGLRAVGSVRARPERYSPKTTTSNHVASTGPRKTRPSPCDPFDRVVRRDQADVSLVVCGSERPPMNLGVALAECRSGRARSGSDGSMTVGYGWLSLFPSWDIRVFSTSARRNREMIGHLGFT